MYLILIRHPETVAVAERIIYGQTESDLTEKGIRSMEYVKERLAGRKIDRLFASPLSRTRILAKKIAEAHPGLDIEIDQRIIEIGVGIFEQLTFQQAKEMYPEHAYRFLTDFGRYRVPGGETFAEVSKRVADFLDELIQAETAAEKRAIESEEGFSEVDMEADMEADEETGEGADSPERVAEKILEKPKHRRTVVISAHAMTIRGALAHLFDTDLDTLWHIALEPCQIIYISYKDGFAKLEGLEAPPEEKC